jgi:hypothetical protein
MLELLEDFIAKLQSTEKPADTAGVFAASFEHLKEVEARTKAAHDKLHQLHREWLVTSRD